MSALRHHRDIVGFDDEEASLFIGRETPVPLVHLDLSRWQDALVGLLTRNATAASGYCLIPAARIIEMETRIEL